MGMNVVCLVGRLTRDPEVKYTSGGHAVATTGLAVDRFTKDAEGKYETDFFTLVAWRKSAEFMGEYLGKGRLVSVAGRLQARSWVDDKSGDKRSTVEIVVENIQGLDKRPDGAKASPADAGSASVPASNDRVPADADPFADE